MRAANPGPRRYEQAELARRGGDLAEPEMEARTLTGPQHYRAAEDLLESLAGKDRGSVPNEDGIVAEAQVHAILALAAATALPEDYQDSRTWRDVPGQE